MLDVNNFITLKKYLAERKIIDSESSVIIEHLPGGVSNSVLKISSNKCSFVLKQALAKLKVSSEWLADVERSNVEKQALKFLHKIVPGVAPELIYEDEDNYLFIMECAPASSVTWKSMLMKQDCNERVGRRVGEILGVFHQKTHNLQEAYELFRNKKFFYQLRIEPFFEFLKSKHPDLKKEIDQHIEQSLDRESSLVMGDYSPKNILVSKENANLSPLASRVMIIDFEVMHYGDSSFDLGFLTTHLLLKSIKFPEYRNSYYNILLHTLNGYFSAVHFSSRTDAESLAVRQLAWILLARVDGKSPAEYITEEKEKQFIRNASHEILSSNLNTYNEVIEFLNLKLN